MQSRYGNCITDEVTEMPRCCSRRIQSEVAWRVALRPFTVPAIWMAPPNSKQLLGERGLAGIRVRDDRKRAPAPDFGSQFRFHGGYGSEVGAAPEARVPALMLSRSTAASSRPIAAW